MTTPRTHIAELARLLNSAPQPIYVMDEDFTLVYLNRSCQQWLGLEESLVGRRCAYHSSDAAAGLDAVAAGLCPPPAVLEGRTVEAPGVRTDADGSRSRRIAKFVPLGGGDDNLLGVLALVTMTDCQAVETSEGDSDAMALHEQIRRFRQLAASRCGADRLIGQGPAMQLARRQLDLAIASRDSVLLGGPPGSGRRQLAAAVHYGATKPRDFAPLDCAALGSDLPEAIVSLVLRGNLSDRPDAPGTLLLHRVDELAAELQVELVHLLLRRPLAWRLIATASEPLVALARRGQFRDDLAAALSTIVIELPPLVQRREDLPLLAQLFLEDLNAAGRRQLGGFTPAALDLMAGYARPGNLDEQAEAVAHAHRSAAGHEIDAADLPARLRLAAQAAARPRKPEETIVLDDFLGRVERELIRRALSRAKGNKARAARLLGLTRPRLYRRMVQLGIE